MFAVKEEKKPSVKVHNRHNAQLEEMSLAQGTLMTDELRPVEPVSLAEQLGNSPFSTPTRTRPKRGTSEDLLCRSPSYTPNFFGDELWPDAVSPEKENFVSPHNCKRHKVNIGHGKV